MLTVKPFTINEGQPTQHYKLVTVPDGDVLYGQPAGGWKTIKGAIRWATKNGMLVIL